MSTEPEAQIDRLNQEIQRQAKRINSMETFLKMVQDAIDNLRPDQEFHLADGTHRTIDAAIAAILDDPAARGETPLLDVE